MTNVPQDVECSARDRPAEEITDEMLEAGAQAIGAWYSEPGEPIKWRRRCAEEVFMAMIAARDGDQSSP
jgi:hypothetical protein